MPNKGEEPVRAAYGTLAQGASRLATAPGGIATTTTYKRLHKKHKKKRGMLTHPTSANIKLKYCILINFLRAVGATAKLARMGFLPRRGKHCR